MTDFGAGPGNFGIPPDDGLRRFRNQIAAADLGLSRKTAVVASVGSFFSLADGIEAGPLAK